MKSALAGIAGRQSGCRMGLVCCGLAMAVSLAICAPAMALPEGRQWELVSPPNKHGYAIQPGFEAGGLTQASWKGDALTYITAGPPVSEPAGNRALEFSQILAKRSPTGEWTSEDIASPNGEAAGLLPGRNTEYLMFSPDLSLGFLEPPSDTPLPPLPSNAEETIYLRNTAAKSFQPLVTAENVRAGAKFGEPKTANRVRFAGASPELSHVVFESIEALTPGTERIEEEAGSHSWYPNLYEWAGGKLQLVSVLPSAPGTEGEQAAHAGLRSYLGTQDLLVTNAVSADGSRVVWSEQAAHGLPNKHMYLRDTSKKETIQIDVPGKGAGGGAEPEPIFQGASQDGSKIFFSDQQRLTLDSNSREGNHPDLYVFEPSSTGSLSGTLTDLTITNGVGIEPEEAAGMQDLILGHSKDGNTVYFVATGVLAAGATPEADNLYVVRDEAGSWTTSFIKTLSGEDSPDWGRFGSAFGESTDLAYQTARVSPSGRYLAFMSNRALTGYSNVDANSGKSDEEVFLYDANSGHIVCASCHLGAQPSGVFDTGAGNVKVPLLYDENEVWAVTRAAEPDPWLAANIPGWTSIAGPKAINQSRYLLDSGQLFFNSADSLVPADANGQVDVYEYRPEGEACNSSTHSASEVYRTEAGGSGCVALISAGTSNQESVFLDASESGEDVFLLSSSRLAPQDQDESFDVYDAHVCTNASPCPAAPASPALPCGEEASCRGVGISESGFETPSSATLSGSGNLPPPAAGSSHTPKPLTRAQKLAKALKACKKLKRAKKRSVCEAKARRTFGAPRSQRRHK